MSLIEIRKNVVIKKLTNDIGEQQCEINVLTTTKITPLANNHLIYIIESRAKTSVPFDESIYSISIEYFYIYCLNISRATKRLVSGYYRCKTEWVILLIKAEF